jgi:methionyl-tRNA formyltransferase
MIRIGFIGCVESSKIALSTLLEMSDVKVAAVATKSVSSINTDFADLVPLCEQNRIPFILADQSLESLEDFFKKFDIDVIYCFGWSHILQKTLLELAPLGVIGFHPAKLPLNRGRHPIIWALALGLNETASTFFRMDEGADSGPILSQVLIDIDKKDDATSLYQKIVSTAQHQILEFTNQLNGGTAKFYTQDINMASYWRKRSRKDGVIDWRMSAEAIHNLIRALAPPYPGAEFLFEGEYVVVKKSRLSDIVVPKNFEPGKVIAVERNSILVKCYADSSIWIEDFEVDKLPKVGDHL